MMIASRRVYYTVIFILSVSVAMLFPHTVRSEDGTPSDVKIKAFEIEYGSGKEQLGAKFGSEGSSVVPHSYAVDDEGKIYICDTLNRRIQVYSSDVQHLLSIPLKDRLDCHDIAVDSMGYVYFYDSFHNRITQVDTKGNVISSINSHGRRWAVMSEGPMDVIKDNLFIRTYGRGVTKDFVIGRISGGKLIPPTDEELRKSGERGVYGPSGRKYIYDFMEGEKGGQVDIYDEGGKAPRRTSIEINKILSFQFIGEDKDKNFFIKSERSDGGVVVEFHKFSPEGDFIKTVRMLKDGTWVGVVKTYTIGNNGDIYQFTREEDKARINIYSITTD